MSELPLPQAEDVHAISPGRVVLGVLFALGWMGAHLMLFYLFFVSGFLLEMVVLLVKTILFNLPQGSATGRGMEHLEWTGMLQAGLVLAGLAGVPGGMAIFLRRRRKMLMILFWLALVAGFVCECGFVVSLVSSLFAS